MSKNHHLKWPILKIYKTENWETKKCNKIQKIIRIKIYLKKKTTNDLVKIYITVKYSNIYMSFSGLCCHSIIVTGFLKWDLAKISWKLGLNWLNSDSTSRSTTYSTRWTRIHLVVHLAVHLAELSKMWRQWYDWMVIWVMYFVENRYEPIRIIAPTNN